jgi:prolyl oligopeptidase
MPLARPTLEQARTVVPHDNNFTIQSFEPTRTKLYVTDIIGGPSDLRVFELTGKPLQVVPTLPFSTVTDIVRMDGDEVLYRNESFIDPPAWFRIPNSGKPVKTALTAATRLDFSDAEVKRELLA